MFGRFKRTLLKSFLSFGETKKHISVEKLNYLSSKHTQNSFVTILLALKEGRKAKMFASKIFFWRRKTRIEWFQQQVGKNVNNKFQIFQFFFGRYSPRLHSSPKSLARGLAVYFERMPYFLFSNSKTSQRTHERQQNVVSYYKTIIQRFQIFFLKINKSSEIYKFILNPTFYIWKEIKSGCVIN